MSSEKRCPRCGGELMPVHYTGGALNEEQWDSVRAGDWYCTMCPSNGRSKTPYHYFWNRELAAPPSETSAPSAPAHEPPIDVTATVAVLNEQARVEQQMAVGKDGALLAKWEDSPTSAILRWLAARIPAWVAAEQRIADLELTARHESDVARQADAARVVAERENATLRAWRDAFNETGSEIDRVRAENRALAVDHARWQYVRRFMHVDQWQNSPASQLAQTFFKIPYILGRTDATVEEIVDAARAASDAAGEPTT